MKDLSVSFTTILFLLFLVTVGCEKENVKENEIGANSVSDIDGNTYKTVKIGGQWWMAENLKTTHYANGTEISIIEDKSEWSNLEYDDRAMSFWGNSLGSVDTYGGLYTWMTAMDGSNSSLSNPSGVQGVCPDGWHMPSDEEWKQLEMYLGMSSAEAYDLGWRGTNEGSILAYNSSLWKIDGRLKNDLEIGTSGFQAIPGGYRYNFGDYSPLGVSAYFWCATEVNNTRAWYRRLSYDKTAVYNFFYDKKYGMSVRCVKDN